MAIIFAYPLIAKEDYPAFRPILGANAPDTHDEWLKLHREQVEQTRRDGNEVVEIEVKYDEFIALCRTSGHTPNQNVLMDFATEKKAGWKP